MITAKVESIDPYAKQEQAGIFLRESLDAKSKVVAILLDQYGDTTTHRSVVGSNISVDREKRKGSWLRLKRQGDTITTYVSSDGARWTQRQQVELDNLLESVYIGLGAITPASTKTTNLVFKHLSVRALDPYSPMKLQTIGDSSSVGFKQYNEVHRAYTLKGSGSSFEGSSDQFQFLGKTFTGDGYMIAHMRNIQSTASGGVAGLMVRESNAEGARFISILKNATEDKVFLTQRNAENTALTSQSSTRSATWLKLRRRGDQLAVSLSYDGVVWFAHGRPIEFKNLADDLEFGLVVTSSNSNELTSADFSYAHVLEYNDKLISTRINPISIGYQGYHRHYESSNIHRLYSAGASIVNMDDQHHFAHTFLEGDGVAIVRLDFITGSYNWASAGLMLRESLSKRSRSFSVQVRQDRRGAYQVSRNSYYSRPSIKSASVRGQFLRIQRRGDTFTSHVSDGVRWVQVGEPVTIPGMSSELYLGLMATSAHPSRTVYTQFSRLTITRGSSKSIVGAKSTELEQLEKDGMKTKASAQGKKAAKPTPMTNTMQSTTKVENTNTAQYSTVTQNASNEINIQKDGLQIYTQEVGGEKVKVLSFERPKNHHNLGLSYKLLISNNPDGEWQELDLANAAILSVNQTTERVEYTLLWNDDTLLYKLETNDENGKIRE